MSDLYELWDDVSQMGREIAAMRRELNKAMATIDRLNTRIEVMETEKRRNARTNALPTYMVRGGPIKLLREE